MNISKKNFLEGVVLPQNGVNVERAISIKIDYDYIKRRLVVECDHVDEEIKECLDKMNREQYE